MPRSYDLNPVSITHHPTQRIDTAIGKLPPFDIQQIIDGFLTALKDLTGIDLTGIRDFLENMFGSIDWSNLPDAGDVWQFVVSTFIQPIIDIVGQIGDALNSVLAPIFGGIDFNDLPSPGEVWQTVIDTLMLPLNLLLGPGSALNAANLFGRIGMPQLAGGVSLSDLTTATSNLLDPFTAESVPSSDGWSFNSGQDAAQVVADGSTKGLWLKSGVIKVEEGQPVNTTVKVKYSGISSGAGQTIRYVLETYESEDGSGPMVPVVVGSITNPTGTISSPVTLGDTSWDIPAGVQSVRPLLEVDELVTAGTVYWVNTPVFRKTLLGVLSDGLPAALQKPLDDLQATWDKFKGAAGGTVDDIEDALNGAGQAIRDAIANALGHSGTGHTSANILTYLQSIPQTVVSGLGDLNTLTNQIRDILAGLVVTPINSTVQAIKDWFTGVVGKTQNLTSGGNLPPANVGSPTGGTNIGQDILDTLNGIWAGLRGAGSTTGKTATDVAAATAATADLVTQVSSIAARLDTSVTQVIRGGGGGATDQFEREDTDLGTDWDSTNTGAGAIATNGSAAYWEPSGGSAATQIARNVNVETATNFQKVSFVLTEPLNTTSGWLLLGRMNSAKTTYTYMFVKKDYREIGYVISGSSTVLATSTDPFDPPPGAKISGHFGVNFYGVVDEDSFSLGDYPGYGNSLNVNSTAPTKGDAYRNMGLGARVSTASGAQVSPGALELWTGGDSMSPPTVGVHLDVDTPVSFTALSGSGPYFASGFFSVTRQSDFITFDDTTTTFTVELPGAYQIFAQLELSAALASGNTMELLLISPSVHSERSMRALAGMVSTQMSTVVYLEAGDTVRLAYTTGGAAAKSVVGTLRVSKMSPPYFA
ncbi:hypothetical protein [Mycolicibacterium sp.]|uniref:DUF7257 domain-containing protein n=1 Tax=Mycolicibacterium sp. TaxID=2320850 RepID=UPI0037CB70FA